MILGNYLNVDIFIFMSNLFVLILVILNSRLRDQDNEQ